MTAEIVPFGRKRPDHNAPILERIHGVTVVESDGGEPDPTDPNVPASNDVGSAYPEKSK